MLRRCQKSAKSKLTILEHFTWSHRIWNNENSFGVRYVHPTPETAQLPQMSSENSKDSHP